MADWKEALSALASKAGATPETAATDATGSKPSAKPSKRTGVVYSTDPNFAYDDGSLPATETLPKNQQKLRVSIERAGRGGKTVTIVRGFQGSDEDLQSLARLLRQKCGVGGSAKDGEIIIQGDHRPRLADILRQEGYTQAK